jgi:hypothetical protein
MTRQLSDRLTRYGLLPAGPSSQPLSGRCTTWTSDYVLPVGSTTGCRRRAECVGDQRLRPLQRRTLTLKPHWGGPAGDQAKRRPEMRKPRFLTFILLIGNVP